MIPTEGHAFIFEVRGRPWSAVNKKGQILYEDLSAMVSDYSQKTIIGGGFDTARVALSAGHVLVRDFVENGVGREMIIYDKNIWPVWEGFVNSVSMELGGVSITVGPFTDIANRVRVSYQTRRWNTNPPIGGNQRATGYAEDLASQNEFGTRTKELSGGEGTQAAMEGMRDTFLADNAWPKSSLQLQAFGNADILNLTIDLLGFYHTLDATYEDVSTGESDLDALILAILQAAPDNIFDTVLAWLQGNTTQVPINSQDEELNRLLDLLRDLLNRGDANDKRYSFGVYEDRQITYREVPSFIEYTYTEESGVFRNRVGAEVHPWEIRPGHWLYVDSILGPEVALPATLDELRRSPSAILIESVDYSMPWNLAVNGIRVSELKEYIERLGLGGM